MEKKREYEITDDEVISEFEDKFNVLLIHHGANNNGAFSYKTKSALYDLEFLEWGNMMNLIEQSLKENKNLLFEVCKDKNIKVTQEELDDFDNICLE